MRRGAITLPIILIMISFFSFCVIVINYSRIHSANLKMSILADSAANSILAKYDDYLYDEYRIMGVSRDVEAASSLNDMAQKTLSNEKSGFNFYGFKNIQVSCNRLSDFSDIRSFKISVLNSNRDLFLVENLEKATKLFKFWQTFMDGKSLSNLYSKAIKIMGELQKSYDECKKINREIEKDIDSLRGYADSTSSNEMLILASASKREQLTEDEKNEIEKAFYYYRKIKSGVHAITRRLTDLKNKIDEKLPRLIEIRRKIEQKKSELRDDEFIAGAQKMIDDIQKFEESLNSALERISEILPEMDLVEEKFENLDLDINKMLSNEGDIDHDEFDISEECEKLKIDIEIFEGKTQEIDGWKVVKFMWKVLKGGLFTNYSRFDLDISNEVYESLPAVRFHRDKINHMRDMNLDEEGKSFGDLSEDALNAYEDSTNFDDEQYQRYRSSNMVEDLVDKCAIMDFALRYFTFNIYEKNGKSIKSLSNNPLYQSEIEYLLHGNQSPKLNMLFTDMQIFGIRNVANSISLLTHKRMELNAISLSISSITFGIGYPVAYGVMLFGWSSLESLADIHELHKGNAIPVFKGRDDIFIDINANTIGRLIDAIEGEGIASAYTNGRTMRSKMGSNASGNGSTSVSKYGVNFDYKDYLFILMSFCEEELLLYRIQDVIQIRGKLKNENFDIESYATMYEVRVEADLPLIYSDLVTSKISSKSVMSY